MKLFKKIMGLGLVTLGVVTLVSCKEDTDSAKDTYTYHTTMAVEPKTFNPHHLPLHSYPIPPFGQMSP